MEIVKTIEHLLCSLFINKIDNLLIEIDGSEIPILDGSIQEFNEKLTNNIMEINKIATSLSIQNYIKIEDYEVFPAQSLEIYCLIGNNILYWKEGNPLFPAKTYGYIQDYPILQQLNLGKGSDPFNTLILSKNKPINNLFLLNYHKIIDFLGDIYTTNIPYISGIFFLNNPNHTKNNKIAIKIMEIYERREKVC